MKIAFVADVHAGNHRRHGGPSERSLNTRCHAIVRVLRKAFDHAEREGCSTVVVLGDLLDSDRPEPQLLADIIAIINSSHMRTILVAGNHDMTSDEPGDNALAPFANVARVVDTPEIVFIRSACELVLVPHAANAPAAERIARALAALPPKRSDLTRLLGFHAGISDAKTAAFLQGTHGSIEALAVHKLMIEHGITYTFAGDWHDRREWPGILQIGALCPTGWDNPGFDGYGGLAIWDSERAGNISDVVEIFEIPGPRFVRTDGPAELRELLKHPLVQLASSQIYISAHLPPDEVATGTRLLEVARVKGGVVAFEVLTTGAGEARAEAHKAASIARSADTLDAALAGYIANAPFDLPDGVTSDHVLTKCQEYLRP